MGKTGKTGVRRVINAFFYSMKGFSAAWKNEAAFRQEAVIFICLVPLALILGSTALEKAMLIGSWMIVIIVELMNSAIEALVDRIGPEHHVLSGQAKDMGSAAVFVSLSLAVVTWLLIILEKMIKPL